MKRFIIIVALFIISEQKNFAQNEDSLNVNSIDAVIENLYTSISGPVGKDRDWNTFRSLFADEARMYIASPIKDSGTVLRVITPEQYIEHNKTRLADVAFTEKEIHRITDGYGAITHVFSTYESHFINTNNEEETVRGINSIQLFFDGNRYYILTICWDADPKNNPVPERYLSE